MMLKAALSGHTLLAISKKVDRVDEQRFSGSACCLGSAPLRDCG
jgi:hypothetical protein